MQSVLIIIHLIVVAALITLVLVQRSEGGGLGIGGGGSGMSSTRAQANALGRTTLVLGTLFFLSCLSLAVLATYLSRPNSILDGAGGVPASTGGGLLDQLRGGSDVTVPDAATQPAVPQAPVSGQPSVVPQAPVAPEAPVNNEPADSQGNEQAPAPAGTDVPASGQTTNP